MLDSKKEFKKKNNKGRIDNETTLGLDSATSETARLIAGLHDRLSALTFEMVGLRGDLASGKSPKVKRSETNPAKSAVPNVSPEALLTTLQSQAQEAHEEFHEETAVVLMAFAQAPANAESETAAAQTTILRFAPQGGYSPDTLQEREETLCERAARIAGSLGAGPRIRIARLLLSEMTLTATDLGTGADLTTGSLYHHLREMTHAGVLQVVSRNRYALTPLGRNSLLALLAFAQDTP